MRAPVIAFEGLPGAGKSTILSALKTAPGVVVVPELLVSADEEAAFTREDFVRHDAEKHRYAYKLASQPDVRVCIMDRSWISVGAYRYGMGDDAELGMQPVDDLPQPDHYIYLRIPAAVSLARRSPAGDRWGDQKAAQRAAYYYDHRFEHDGFPVTVIDATRPVDTIISEVRALIPRT